MLHGLTAAVTVVAAVSLVAHDPITTKVTWVREIAPIIQARCLSCHSSGGRAPMALTTYDEARPWARAIREEVLARRMPKWPVVRGYGDFIDDPSLSPFEIALITAWADGGAPRTVTPPAVPPAPPVPALVRPPATPAPAAGPAITTPCASRQLPGGRLRGVQVMMAAGGSLRLTLRSADGLEEPLIWIRDFDPSFPETYWLRNPVQLARGSQLVADGPRENSPACSVTLRYSK